MLQWSKNRLNQVLIDIILILLIILAGLKLTHGLEHVLDIALYDESGYLYAGVNLAEKGLMPPAWAPLYGIWYYFLSFFTPDNVLLYYLNYRVLTILPSVLLYLVLRAYVRSLWIALPIAWLFLIAMGNVSTWPKPSHFALCIILTFLLLGRKLLSPTRSTLFMAVAALLCSYVRPEFFLTFVLLTGVYFFLLWRNRQQMQPFNEFVTAAFGLLACFALIALFNLALLDTRNNRSFEAFAQHFAINWNTWNDPDIDPWIDYEQAIVSSFGKVDSVSAAVHNNPAAFARHIFTNVIQGPHTLFQLLFVHYNILLPARHSWAAHLEGYFILVGLVSLLMWSSSSWRQCFFSHFRQNRLLLVYLMLFITPGVMSAVLIYPRNHYLLIPGVLITIAGVLLLTGPASHLVQTFPWHRRWYPVLLGGLLIIITPNIATDWYPTHSSSARLETVQTIQFIRALQINTHVNLLEAEGGYYIYLGDHFQRISHASKDIGFNSFVDQHDIDMIIVSSQLRSDIRYAHDPEWHAFLDNPTAAGYSALEVPETDRLVIMKTNLLSRPHLPEQSLSP
jgi:hypothetical protein